MYHKTSVEYAVISSYFQQVQVLLALPNIQLTSFAFVHCRQTAAQHGPEIRDKKLSAAGPKHNQPAGHARSSSNRSSQSHESPRHTLTNLDATSYRVGVNDPKGNTW